MIASDYIKELAKSKAREIYEKFYYLADPGGYCTDVEYIPGNDETRHVNAKKCAMFMVEQLIDQTDDDILTLWQLVYHEIQFKI